MTTRPVPVRALRGRERVYQRRDAVDTLRAVPLGGPDIAVRVYVDDCV